MDSEDYKNVASADTDFTEPNDLEQKKSKMIKKRESFLQHNRKHLEKMYNKPMF
jgi:hypothetical protein